MDRQKEDVTAAMIIDFVLLGYGAVMAPMWNKVLAQSKRDSLNGGNAGTIKDEINDLIKGSGALAKDIVTSKMKAASERGTDIKVADAMQMIAQGWRETIEKSAEKLFDGSEDSVLKLTLLMTDGAMIEKKVISELNPSEALGSLKKTLNSQLIPLVWSTTSAQIYPVIIRVSRPKACSAIVVGATQQQQGC
ncbi:hypothetical protein CC79DRAFT_1055586 [Sarocladium strictum]